MLKELLPLLRKGDTLGLSIACETSEIPGVDGAPPTPARFRVNVMPKLFTLDGEKSAARLALNTPLSLTGTAEELDSPEFVATLNRFTLSATTARHTIDEAEAAHKTAAEKVPKKAAPTPPAKKPEPKAGGKPQGSKPASWKDRVKPGAKPAPASLAETAEETVTGDVPEPPAQPKNAEEATPSLM